MRLCILLFLLSILLSPRYPRTIIVTSRIIIWSNAHCRVSIFTQKELVNEGFNFRILHLWKLTMTMTSNNGIANAVGNAKALPHLDGCVGRYIHGRVGKPFVIRIAQQQHGTWTTHGHELVTVMRKSVHFFFAEVLFQTLLEPVVICLVKVLHITQCA